MFFEIICCFGLVGWSVGCVIGWVIGSSLGQPSAPAAGQAAAAARAASGVVRRSSWRGRRPGGGEAGGSLWFLLDGFCSGSFR